MIVYSNIPTVVTGGQRQAVVTDSEAQILLTDMLKELKKINLYMAIENDMVIENTEVEI